MKTLSEIRQAKTAVFTFGRMNPPTAGHEKLIRKVLDVAHSKGADPFVYVSFTQDPSKNPLTNKQKIKYIRLGVPEAAKAIKEDPKVRTPHQAITRLIELGYQHIIMVVGDDRVKQFRKEITPYVNHPDKKKSFEIDKFEVVSAGERDPDDEGVTGISGTKMREAAIHNKYSNFRQGVPSGLSDRFSREMFELVKKGMKIAESILRTQGSLNIPRNKMPQIMQDHIKEFIKELEKEGIPVSMRSVPISTLKPTQKEVNSEKILKKMDALSSGATPKPFIISIDNFVLDGHHQFYALKELDSKSKVVAYIVGLKMNELLKYAHDFDKVGYKEIDE